MPFVTLINRILEKTLIFLMVILVADVFWQVFSRYVLNSPSSFTDELAGYLLIWVGLLGAAYVSGKKEHLAIDILYQRSSAKMKFYLDILIDLLIILFSLTVLTTGGIWLVYTRLALDVQSAALGIQLGYIYMVIPLSGLLILYFSLDSLVNNIKNNT